MKYPADYDFDSLIDNEEKKEEGGSGAKEENEEEEGSEFIEVN